MNSGCPCQNLELVLMLRSGKKCLDEYETSARKRITRGLIAKVRLYSLGETVVAIGDIFTVINASKSRGTSLEDRPFDERVKHLAFLVL